MFEKGKVYKVKVESIPGEAGFGRATIVDRIGSQLCVQLKTSREANKVLPKGTRIWFVSDSPTNTFNGMWSSSVIGAQIAGGRTVMVCATPRLEALLQRRRTPRVVMEAPVKMFCGDNDHKPSTDCRSQDISRSGIALETPSDLPQGVEVGTTVALAIQSPHGDINARGRIIRIDKNWLANKNILGLEFVEISPENKEALEKLLILLGSKAKKDDNEEDSVVSGLFGWMGGRDKEDTSLVKGASVDNVDDVDDVDGVNDVRNDVDSHIEDASEPNEDG